MPLLQYFGWVGGFLLAALFAANWCYSPPGVAAPASDVPLDRKINIRIHTDHKWPERVVFDTTRSSPPPEAKAEADVNVGAGEVPAPVEREPFDAFAQMTVFARPCFRPPCSSGSAVERQASPTENSASIQDRSSWSIAARKRAIFPSPLHKPQGKS
jgi:hypothetical protein